MAEYKATWNLASVPDDAFYAEAARRMVKRRKVSGGARAGAGRPKEFVPCPRGCGQMVTKTQAIRGHGCQGAPHA
jgi:hypothetical protein